MTEDETSKELQQKCKGDKPSALYEAAQNVIEKGVKEEEERKQPQASPSGSG